MKKKGIPRIKMFYLSILQPVSALSAVARCSQKEKKSLKGRSTRFIACQFLRLRTRFLQALAHLSILKVEWINSSSATPKKAEAQKQEMADAKEIASKKNSQENYKRKSLLKKWMKSRFANFSNSWTKSKSYWGMRRCSPIRSNIGSLPKNMRICLILRSIGSCVAPRKAAG